MKGFTLVELVLVISLISILTIVTNGLFFRADQFTALAAREQLISSAQLAQKRALANASSSSPVTLTISQTASVWAFSVEQGTTSIDEQSVTRSGATLTVNSVSLGDGNSVAVSFDEYAETSANNEFTFSADSIHTLCISSTGFAYIGSCQP